MKKISSPVSVYGGGKGGFTPVGGGFDPSTILSGIGGIGGGSGEKGFDGEFTHFLETSSHESVISSGK